uniref:Uncharacterized protein n=1 Tax=Oryzias melastigma TaxID=30732 RepID=A0A3B3CCD5_ORYME
MLHGLKKPRFSLQTRTHVSPISTLCVQEAWSDDGEGQEMEQTSGRAKQVIKKLTITHTIN